MLLALRLPLVAPFARIKFVFCMIFEAKKRVRLVEQNYYYLYILFFSLFSF